MKTLPIEDFRALRAVLEAEDFALGPDTPDPPPRDLIHKSTWSSITSLPDDVSIRTSNDYGSVLNSLWGYWSAWVSVAAALEEESHAGEKILGQLVLDCADEFQASIFNAMVGFYRIAFSALRNVLETLTVGLRLDLKGDSALIMSWFAMNEERLGFGGAANVLCTDPRVRGLEDQLAQAIGDDLFRQKTPTSAGGFARRLFGDLSKFTHGIPKFTNADMWKCNGPVFVPRAFEKWSAYFLKTYAVALIASKLDQPKLRALACDSKPTVSQLFTSVVSSIPQGEDGHRLLRSVPSQFWV